MSEAQGFRRIFATLAVYVVLGPLIGTAFALAIVTPIAMAAFGPGIAGAIGAMLLGNPWLPYYYGLVPAALAGILVVILEAQSGAIGWRRVALVGAVVGFGMALVSFRPIFSGNATQTGLMTASSLFAALGCHAVLRVGRRRLQAWRTK